MKKLFSKLIAVLFIIALIFPSCKEKAKPEAVKIDDGFSAYISGFTSGVVSSQSNIRIRLNGDLAQQVEPGTEADEKFFNFSPSVKGKTYWVDNRTLEFKPDRKLKSGTLYKVDFSLSKLAEVPEKFKTFAFQFQTTKISFRLREINIKPYSAKAFEYNQLKGVLYVSDYMENEEVEKILSAKQDEKSLAVKWRHFGTEKKHEFQLDSIKRQESGSNVVLSWDGAAVDSDDKGQETIEVPGLDEFKVTKMEVIQQPAQYILLQFSDPIAKAQNLNGMIRVKGEGNLKFVIEDNQIKAYPRNRINGTKTIIVSSGIKNTFGYKLKKTSRTEITFEAVKPAVKLIGKGVIMPNSNGLIFPFQSVNLNAVDVRVVKIFENNIAQFLQVNNLDGSSQLKRVGRLVLKKKIDLVSENLIDYGKWNAFSFDLSDLMEIEPGAIYKVEIGFRKAYSMYPCSDDSEEESEEIENWDDEEEKESSYWDSAENYYSYNDYYYYNWRDRDNPCHKAYYGTHRRVSRNVLASNLGIIAKAGNNRKIHAAVTDLRSTKPLAGVEVRLINYQQQLIAKAITDSKGLVELNYSSKPFMLVAAKGDDRGYLKLNDGNSLSLSKFDVTGNVVQKGIKGFLYGERGVWRPGDTLFLNFILEDKNKVLPESHPVVFELINPQGQLVKRSIKSSGVGDFYSFITITDPEAPTGNWTGRVRVGGSVFEKVLKIEAVKPNRLKIKIDIGADKIYGAKNKVQGTLQANWLHGAVAKNLKAEMELVLKPVTTKFKKYRDFIFDDPASDYSPQEFTVFDDRVDSEGKANFMRTVNIRSAAPGMLKAVFTTRVFETGGDYSIDQFSVPYAPFDKFVGVKLPKGDKARGMLLTDTDHEVEVVTVDADGNPISVNNLEATVYKINWRWWWERSSDNLASYIGRSNHRPIVKKKFSTKEGVGSFKFEIKYPDWGRYLVRIKAPGGHATGKTCYVDWPGWAGRAQKDNPGGASMLVFTADKQKYTVGEEVSINIPSSEGGRALVSIENGSKVVASYWVETKEKETYFKFNATEDMAPNVYVNITMLQPHAQTANDLPIRLYGVVPIFVEDPATKIQPELIMADELSPEKEVEIKVKEQNGKAMTYTVAMVDDGLLDLTRFKTPDPHKTFYAREALGVKTWDVYDMVLGAYGGKLEQLFSIGGDGELEGKAKKKANRFKPVVKFFGPFELKAGKTAKHKFIMPKYIGSVRTMIVAGKDGAYGFNDKTTPVKNPLMILATLPRVLGPGETVKLPVNVFAMDDKIKSVELQVKTNKFLKLEDNPVQTVTFDEVGDKIQTFNIKVAEELGVGTVKIIATSGSFTAEYDIELDVRNPNPPVVNTFSKILEPGKSISESFNVIGIKGTNTLNFEVSSLPPLNLGRRLKYLIRYPHGCVEQTTSSVFPQLFLKSVMEISDEMEAKITDNIEAGINRLSKFQLSDGGLGYWPNASDANDWGTNYAGHFMLEAEAKGYALPINFKDNWLNYQRNRANQWSETDRRSYSRNDLIQAYRLYTLALANEPELGAMNRMREMESISAAAKWRLAAAYALIGKPEVAKEITANVETIVKNNYVEMSYTYGSGLRDQAMILETLGLMKNYDAGVPVIEKISEQLNSQRWMSTQTTAYSLLAMAKFSGNNKGTANVFDFSWQVNNGKEESLTKVGNIKQISIDYEKRDSLQLNVTNDGEAMIYLSFVNEGTPLVGDATSAAKNLNLSIRYTDKNGNAIDVSRLAQGTDFRAEVTIKNPGQMGHYKEMALTQIFPSGWEIHNTRLFESGVGTIGDVATYMDIRDDRVYTYFDVLSGKSKKFVILLNAAYLGKYYLPTVDCEAMYDNRINARKPGKWVEVVE